MQKEVDRKGSFVDPGNPYLISLVSGHFEK